MQLVAVGVLAGIPAQAVLGGITVLTGLNPWLVMGHFLLSMVLVAFSAALVRGARDDVSGPGELVVHPLARRLALGTSAVGAVVLLLGTIVTGSGPHSGDADRPARTGFDPRFVSWMHADAVMLFCRARHRDPRRRAHHRDDRRGPAVPGTWCSSSRSRRGSSATSQYFTGLPELLVLVHMLGASLLVVTLTFGVLSTRRHPV